MISSHEPELVVLSIVVACAASYAALFLAGHVANTRGRLPWLIAAASAMGLGIWSMHFVAMLAYRLPVDVSYDAPLLALSLLIAVCGSALGFEVASRSHPSTARIALTGPIMGVAIVGMHYTGMAAMRLPATARYDVRLVIASVVIAVAASYAAIALFLRFRHDRSRRGAWLQVASAVVMGHAVAGMHYTAMAAVHFHSATFAPEAALPSHTLAFAIAISTTVVLGLIVAGAAVDRRARAARVIRESEERLRAIMDSVQDYAIFTVDGEGRINGWNRGAERLLGYASEEILGEPVRRLYPEETAAAADAELRAARETGRCETEGVRRTKHGDERHVHVTTTAMHDVRGDLIGYTRIMRDITERIRAERELRHRDEQLRQSQKMEAVGQLAGGIAHDFNNMLTAIRGYADLLDEPGRSASDREAIAEICKAADRAAALTRQLLAYSRKQVLQPRAVNPNAIVAEMESMLQRLMVGDVHLVTRLHEEDALISVDPAQIEQVLLNLVVNARDAMPSGGVVLVETSVAEFTPETVQAVPGAQPGRHVVLAVRDTGRGIPEQVKEHIFEPFFTTKPRGAGTGLGLSTVYGIVKQSGGHICVESQVGLGSVFRIAFPVADDDRVRSVQPVHPREEPAAGETVLVVDDEESVRRMVAAALKRAGYHVLVAHDGLHGLEVASAYQGDIDLLITDIMMPHMHGKELSERMSAVRPSMRVLFTSGYADHHIIERGLLEPWMSFIQKPFTAAELSRKVIQVLQAPIAQPALAF